MLCIFPSRYLFAIGLSPIFSFRRNLPPTLSCNPKQLDSLKVNRTHMNFQPQTGLSPSVIPCSKGLWPESCAGITSWNYNSERTRRSDFQVELIPLHSPLLGESWLVSFPPLSYMLKSRGSPFLIWGLNGKDTKLSDFKPMLNKNLSRHECLKTCTTHLLQANIHLHVHNTPIDHWDSMRWKNRHSNRNASS